MVGGGGGGEEAGAAGAEAAPVGEVGPARTGRADPVTSRERKEELAAARAKFRRASVLLSVRAGRPAERSVAQAERSVVDGGLPPCT